MNTKKLLHELARKAYRSKVFDVLAYIRSAHMNYVAFILTLVNLVVVLMGIVLPALNVPPSARPLIAFLSLVILTLVVLVLGWIDVNAGVTRKTVIKQAYWRKPSWHHAAVLTGRIYSLADVVTLWLKLKKEGKLDEETKRCLRETANNTIYWVYIGTFDIKKDAKLPSKECLKKFFELAGVELSEEEIKRVFELLGSPEYS